MAPARSQMTRGPLVAPTGRMEAGAMHAEREVGSEATWGEIAGA